MKAKVLIRPKEGILDPQGKAVERALPALGFEGVHDVRVGRLVELETDDPAKLDALCEKLLANPLIEDFEIELETVIGVIQFPGSCDERDALGAVQRVGEGRLVWHEETDLSDLDGVIVPGGFSYGDYLRAGAIARFSPAMEAVARFAADGGRGARHLQRLPGALRGRAASRRAAAERGAALHLPPGRAGGGGLRSGRSARRSGRAIVSRSRSST